jgi:hypothetical protein
MTKIFATAAALLMFIPYARAENWKTIDSTPDGTIMEIDMDTIHRNKDGSASVLSQMGADPMTVFFDCKGHYGPVRQHLIHIPHRSIAESTADVVCQVD